MTGAMHTRVLAREVSEPDARFNARRGRFQLRDGSLDFAGVRVLGICTQLARTAESCCELQIGTFSTHS